MVLIHRDVTKGTNLYWSFHSGETYRAYDTDIQQLHMLLGACQPSGVISDWKGAIVSSVSRYFPTIPHQRCLTHVVREAKRYLPKRSPFMATRELRYIAESLVHITSKEEKVRWIKELIQWEYANGYLLKEKTIGVHTRKRWWYTHDNIRSAWRLLTHCFDPFFVHLDHPHIPHSNNSLEGVNSQMKAKLTSHRGMSTNQQVSFLFWYLTFTRVKTKQDLKKLWDMWKKTKKDELATVYVT